MDYFFTKCLNPQRIRNQYTNESMVVGCGKCEACLLQKSSVRALKCKLETLSHKYCLFVTLTYSNDYIPKMIPICVSDNQYDSIDNYADIPNEYYFIKPDLKDEIVSTAVLSFNQLKSLQDKCKLGRALPYLNKRDIQLFIKRLRKNISKYSNEKIRYYAVGEYGPVHFRPHFHILLWFSSEQINEVIRKSIFSSWQYGRIDVQTPKGDCSNYVAGYLNGSCNLPRLFKTRTTQPFACHSRFLGEAILQKQKEQVYEMAADEFISRSISLNGSVKDVHVWKTYITAFYPRCPRFATSSTDERIKSYRCYQEASERYGISKPYLLAKKIIEEIKSNKINYTTNYFKLLYNLDNYNIGESLYKRALRSIYMELRTSEHFYRFVCDSINNNVHQYNCIRMIEMFYLKVDMLNLNTQFDNQTEFLKYDGCDVDDLILFYDKSYYSDDVLMKLQNSKPFKVFRENCISNYRRFTKHKELNDLNQIFIY